jgi:hypothetical protein
MDCWLQPPRLTPEECTLRRRFLGENYVGFVDFSSCKSGTFAFEKKETNRQKKMAWVTLNHRKYK